eukprot:TRINITY_DN43166_c0_g1_i1.p1 TRINITY_DN43166_c0_g1~~TRINITY_DN43166_c0_g1_i1.p1  ORF type:complete len:226 (+),score=93.22 TRINITY_DN43166_c0_g1_i1:63-680(+)
MRGLFGGGGEKKTVDQHAKDAKRGLKSGQRDLDRTERDLARREEETTKQIKKMLEKGDEQGAKVLAKSLLDIRNQRARMQKGKAHMAGMEARTSVMAAQHKQMQAMGTAASVMGKMNAQIDPMAMQRVMQDFEQQSMKMDMVEDVMDDAFDGLDEGMDDDVAAVMDEVFDSVGLDLKHATTAPQLPAQAQQAAAAAGPSAAALHS